MTDILDHPADAVPLLALDFETTGLAYDADDRVIEVGLSRYEPSTGVRTERSALIYPDGPIALRSQAIHGIRDEMVADSPTFADVLPWLRPLFSDAVLLAHNAPFDLGFLAAECARLDAPAPQPAAVVDTLDMARHIFRLPSCRLQAIAKRIGLPHHGAHRALADARATLAIFRHMLPHVTPDGVPTVSALQDLIAAGESAPRSRQGVREQLQAAMEQGTTVEIDYTSFKTVGSLTTRRQITVLKLKSRKVDAYCHLREARRTFRLERIRNVLPLSPK
ncbi:MAG: exonuclease domain-containing protein [Myxococcota bacterium]